MAEKIRKQATESEEVEDTSAGRAVTRYLQTVKVSKHDATRLQQQLEREIFQCFSGRCEVVTNTKVLFSDLNIYLDGLQRAFEGIDSHVRKIIDTALFMDKSWDSKMVEWKYRTFDDSGAGYSMIAFGRSHNQQYVDIMLVCYKMNYVLKGKEDIKKTELAWFNTVFPYTFDKNAYEDVPLDDGSINPIQNFFRVEALERLFKKGLIKSIDFVNSLDDIPESTPKSKHCVLELQSLILNFETFETYDIYNIRHIWNKKYLICFLKACRLSHASLYFSVLICVCVIFLCKRF